MLFFEPLFAFQAFPVLFSLYHLLRNKPVVARWFLLVASVAFYVWGEPLFVPVVLASAGLDFALLRAHGRVRNRRARSLLLALGVAHNLGILIFYKYADFLLQNLYALASQRAAAPALGLELPIGVSFIVFEKISCLMDVHRGTTPRPQRLSEYCVFVFFFPKLLAGPIIKYHEIRDQIATPPIASSDDIITGLERFARGAVKKLLIADQVGLVVTAVFQPGAELSLPAAWLGLLCFTLQIYFDFSAYSDMAIGLGRMLGFELRENFALPYTARSLTEFWRRWHISLSTWIRDYLYFPLGGSQRSTARTYLNLWLCFLATGIWHGAAWSFVLWGAYNGAVLTLERLFLGRLLARANAYLANLATLGVVMVGWVMFRSSSLEHMSAMFRALFNPWAAGGLTVDVDNLTACAIVVGVVICALPRLPGYAWLERRHVDDGLLKSASSVGLAVLFVFACGHMLASSLRPFLYFRF